MKLTLKALLTLASVTGICCANLCAGPFQTVSAPDPSLVPASAGADSLAPMITPDGRYVVFSSTAANLATDTNGAPLSQTFPATLNVFLRDRASGKTTLVSADQSLLNGANGDSVPDDISTNGQFVAYESSSIHGTNINITDIFLRDTVSGTTTLISATTNGTAATGLSRSAVMTPDGRYVAFVSAATNLVDNDTNNIPDIFLRDTWSNTTTLISVGATATTNTPPYINTSESPEITPDGRYVAFYSTATNLVAGGTNSGGEIYLRDTVAGTTICASVDAHSIVATNNSGYPNNISYDHCISADGQFVAYQAKSTLSGPNGYFPWGIVLRYNVATVTTDVIDTNGWAPVGPNEEVRTLDMTPDGRYVAYMANFPIVSSGQIAPNVIKVWDAKTGLSTLVNVNLNGGPSTNYVCDSPSIDPTGRFVTFISNAPDLVSNSVPPGYHCYIRDLQSNTTTLVDVNTNGAIASVLPTAVPRMSADARYVAFQAFDNQLVPSDLNHAHDIFVRDLTSGDVELVSARETSLPGSSTAAGQSILSRSSVSGNGRFVAFSSLAENLVTNDNNKTRDIFVRDLLTGSTRLISVSSNGVSANNGSFDPSISADGRYVVFASYANDIAPVTLAYRTAENIYLADLQTGTTTLISQVGGQTANGNSFSPLISRNGTFVLFHSRASNLGGGSGENLFLYSLQNSNLVALTSGGVTDAAISDNGRVVVFSGTRSGTAALYIWDTQLGAIRFQNTGVNARSIAVTRDGSRYTYASGTPTQYLYDNATNNIGPVATIGHYSASFSADGNLLAYGTPTDIKIYDFTTQSSILVSHTYSSASTPASGISDFPDISADGRYVVYRSTASNLVQNITFPDTNGAPRLYVYDTQTGTNKLFSIGPTITFTNSGIPGSPSFQLSTPGNARSFSPVFSADGHTVVFSSYATDLVNSDFNENTDIFEFAFLYADVNNSPDGVTVSWLVAPGQTYHVQYKDNVGDPTWQILNGTINTTGNRASITDTSATSAHRIYRVAAF